MKAAARQQFSGFDDAFLAKLADQQQKQGDEFQRRAAGCHRAAKAARNEIQRRKQGAGDGKPNRD